MNILSFVCDLTSSQAAGIQRRIRAVLELCMKKICYSSWTSWIVYHVLLAPEATKPHQHSPVCCFSAGLFSYSAPTNALKRCDSFLALQVTCCTNICHTALFCSVIGALTSLSLFLSPVFLVWGRSLTVIMADESDMRNELADLQTRADQIADEV